MEHPCYRRRTRRRRVGCRGICLSFLSFCLSLFLCSFLAFFFKFTFCFKVLYLPSVFCLLFHLLFSLSLSPSYYSLFSLSLSFTSIKPNPQTKVQEAFPQKNVTLVQNVRGLLPGKGIVPQLRKKVAKGLRSMGLTCFLFSISVNEYMSISALSVYLLFCVSVYLSILLSVNLSIYLSVYASLHFSIYRSFNQPHSI